MAEDGDGSLDQALGQLQHGEAVMGLPRSEQWIK